MGNEGSASQTTVVSSPGTPYGLGDAEEWIASYGGLAATGDTLFLYDPVRPRVVRLSGELEERAAG